VTDVPGLTLDQWLDILGYALLAIAAFTILSFLSASHGLIPGWWLGLLRRGFGWGAYLVPLFVGAVGLWLVLRHFGDRLPRVTLLQIVGGMLGYLALLITLHFPAALILFDGDLQATAEAGHGGGYLGAALGRLLLEGLGSVGLVITLITWWLIVVALTFGTTAQDAIRAFQRLQGHLRPRRPRPLPTVPRPSLREAPVPPEQVAIRPAPSARPAPTSAPPTIPAQPRLIGGQQARIIEETLASLGAPVRVKEINRGPVVTQFGIEPLVVTNSNGKETRVKVSRVAALADDVALALEAKTPSCGSAWVRTSLAIPSSPI